MIIGANAYMNWYFRERDSLIAHGASNFLLERLFGVSDKFKIYICSTCKTMCNNVEFCDKCNNDDIRHTSIPYASKILFQYLLSVGISMRFETSLQ